MKHLGKQSKHLTVCPDLCQAWGQNGELMQHVITVKAQCQGYTYRLNYTYPPGPRRVTIKMGPVGPSWATAVPAPMSGHCLSRSLLKED